MNWLVWMSIGIMVGIAIGYEELEKKIKLRIKEIYQRKNVASAKVIQNNNGILENEVFSETFSEITQRYWINL